MCEHIIPEGNVNEAHIGATLPVTGQPFYGMWIQSGEGNGAVSVQFVESFDPDNPEHVRAYHCWHESVVGFFKWAALDGGPEVMLKLAEHGIRYVPPSECDPAPK